MKKTIIFCLALGFIQNCFALNDSSVRKWIKEEYNITDVIITNTQYQLDNNELFIAYHKILTASHEEYYGMFDRAVIFYQVNETNIPLVFFNGPIVINPNGNRIFDFSGEKYQYLQFFGWEIDFAISKKYGLAVNISLRQNNGKNVADSIGIHYDNDYHQFVVSRSPFDSYFLLDTNEPKFIGLARNGYDSSNEFVGSVEVFLSELTKDELRLCRNAIYAVNGFRFSDEKLLSYFYQYNWYKPGLKEENDNIRLTPEQELLKTKIIQIEEKK